MHYDPIIPFRLFSSDGEDFRKIKKEYGFHRFFIGTFNMNTPEFELPSIEEFEEFGRTVKGIREKLNDPDIELNWWCAPTLGYAKKSDYQRIINFNGTASDECACPLDEKFRNDLAARVSAAARIARFPLIQFEDDCELSNHPGVTFGCFCPLHMAELSKRIGREITREELVQMFKENKRETMPLRRIFNDMRRESVVLLATAVRKALDEVSPETRISICEPGTTDFDGDLSSALPPAFAGKNLQPLIRVFGSNYCSNDSPQTLPWQTAHAMFSAERLPKDWELMHESDTFPHSRFFMSEKYLRTLMANAYFFGMTNSLLYACQYLDDPCEDTGYLAMARDNRLFFRELISSCQEGHLDGVRVYHHPESTSMPRLAPSGTVWIGDTCYPLGRLGIPYSTKHGSPVVLSGAEADTLSDGEIMNLLGGSLLLDATAAEILDKRGFSHYTGVKTELLNGYNFSFEKLEDIPDFSSIKGRLIYNYAASSVATESSQFRNILPLAGTEVMSYLTDNAQNRLQPGMCRFENKLGGRIGILAYAFSGNISSNLLCYRKKQMMKILIEWLRKKPLPAFIAEEPNVWLLVRETAKYSILAVTALTCSQLDNVKVILPPELQGAVEELQMNGQWTEMKMPRNGNSLVIPHLDTLATRIFRIAR